MIIPIYSGGQTGVIVLDLGVSGGHRPFGIAIRGPKYRGVVKKRGECTFLGIGVF